MIVIFEYYVVPLNSKFIYINLFITSSRIKCVVDILIITNSTFFFLFIQLCNIFVFFDIYRSKWKKLWHFLMLFFEEPIVKQIKMSWNWPLNNTCAWYEFKQNIHIKWNKYLYIVYKWSDTTIHITCDMHEETNNSFSFEFF